MLETFTITAESIESNIPYKQRFLEAIKAADKLEKSMRRLHNRGLASEHNMAEVRAALRLLRSASKSFLATPSSDPADN